MVMSFETSIAGTGSIPSHGSNRLDSPGNDKVEQRATSTAANTNTRTFRARSASHAKNPRGHLPAGLLSLGQASSAVALGASCKRRRPYWTRNTPNSEPSRPSQKSSRSTACSPSATNHPSHLAPVGMRKEAIRPGATGAVAAGLVAEAALRLLVGGVAASPLQHGGGRYARQ